MDHFSVGDTFWEAAVNKTNSIIRILELIFSVGKGGPGPPECLLHEVRSKAE